LAPPLVPLLHLARQLIAVIADDLTGAAELGAVGLRRGVRAQVVLRGRPTGQAELVCLDTDSRSCTAAEAGTRAANAAQLLANSGARWIYKKVDSVLRGQVLAEVEAIMGALRLPQALLVPCNPSLGRVIRNGNYFVHGVPLHQTEFARDPEHPRTTARVLDLLGTGTGQTHLACPDDPRPECGIVVGEAATSEDLQRWAARRVEGTLLAGGAEFFAALLASEGPGDTQHRVSHELGANATATDRELFVCGSTSPTAEQFVNRARDRGTPVFSLPDELARGGAFSAPAAETLAQSAAAALQAHRRVILNVGLPLIADPSIAVKLSPHLVVLAQAVLARVGVAHLYVEGGATAAALARCMGWKTLTVLRELALGVATLSVDEDPRLQLTIKPGSYAWPSRITDLPPAMIGKPMRPPC